MRLLLCGGGTGGHLLPAFAVVREVQKIYPSQFLWLITRRGEEKYLPADAGDIARMPMTRFSLSPSCIWNFLHSIWFCRNQIRKFRPDACLTFGGYASIPGVLASWLHRIPIAICEVNVLPGKASRFLSLFARKIFIAYPDTQRYFPAHKNIVQVGIPIRQVIFSTTREQGCQLFGLKGDSIHILITGGSQGSEALNQGILQMARQWSSQWKPPVEAIHQVGARAHPAEIQKQWESLGIHAVVKEFFPQMAEAIACADLAISRAGGSTVAELMYRGVPTVFLPYPYAGKHQMKNAEFWAEIGAAKVIIQDDSWQEVCGEIITQWINDSQLREEISRKSRPYRSLDASIHIAQFLHQYAKI